MPVVYLFALVASYFAARSVLSRSEAHRTDQADTWMSPRCSVCSENLSPILVRCAEGHTQRPVALVSLAVLPLLFLGVVASVPMTVVPAYLWFAYLMVLLTVTDLDTKLIPNRILLPGTVVGGVVLLVGGLVASDWSAIGSAVVGGAAFFAVMLVLAVVARGALGFGDVKLAFVIGLFCGYLSWQHVLLAAFGAFLLGGLVSLVLLVTKLKSRKDAIPFGPFMTVAALVTVLAGDAILSWYAG